MENKHRKSWKELGLGLKVLIIIGGAILLAGVIVLAGFVVMWLWNWLMPKLFGLTVINYWEAWGILILSHILFGKKHGFRHLAERSRKHKLHEKLRAMHGDISPEAGPILRKAAEEDSDD
jgi:hypothetical protein